MRFQSQVIVASSSPAVDLVVEELRYGAGPNSLAVSCCCCCCCCKLCCSTSRDNNVDIGR